MIEFKYKPGDVVTVLDFRNMNFPDGNIPFDTPMTWRIGEEHAIIACVEFPIVSAGLASINRFVPAYFIDSSGFAYDERWLELAKELVPREKSEFEEFLLGE